MPSQTHRDKSIRAGLERLGDHTTSVVGQNVHSRRAERRENEAHAAVMAAHRETQEILAEIHTLTRSQSK